VSRSRAPGILGLGLTLALACDGAPTGSSGEDTGTSTGGSTGGSSEASSTGAPTCEAVSEETVLVFGAYCAVCHGPYGSRQASIDYITELERLVEHDLVVPGDLEKSRVYVRMTADSYPMPPLSQTRRPTAEDIDLVRRWILECAADYVPTLK
jgi:hypothetical protein